MGRTGTPITFSSTNLEILKNYANSRTAPYNFIQRAKILIALFNQQQIKLISKICMCSNSTVSRLKRKALEKVIDPTSKDYIQYLLNDRYRSGRKIKYNIEQQNEVLATQCKGPKESSLPGTIWTYRRLRLFLNQNSNYTNLSISYISKLNKRRKIIPHKVRYFLTSKDPKFKEKGKNMPDL